jgi:SAM-dependent methyltransferase
VERSAYDRLRAVQSSHWWHRARRSILEDQIGRLDLGADPRVLEVGCGSGGNLAMLSRFGRVTGVENDETSRAYASEVFGQEILPGRLPEGLPSKLKNFDLIAALDVIEHIEDDEGTVAELAARLKDGGYLIATVPAHQWMWSRHDEEAHHQRRYGRPDFVRLFRNAGLQVRRATYFNSLLFPLAIAVRLADRGGDTSHGASLPSPPVNATLHAVFALERAILQWIDQPTGLSLLVVAQRPGRGRYAGRVAKSDRNRHPVVPEWRPSVIESPIPKTRRSPN